MVARGVVGGNGRVVRNEVALYPDRVHHNVGLLESKPKHESVSSGNTCSATAGKSAASQ